MEPVERYRGCLLGLAVGDALGAPLECLRPGSFTAIDDFVEGGFIGISPGEWTDDTAMALCLAESLICLERFDPTDQLERYLRWYREGYLSCTGYCYGIGSTVRDALIRFENTREPYCGSTDPFTAGNGPLMRLAPIPMFYAQVPREAIRKSGDSSRTTHQAVTAIDACRYFGGLLVGALGGESKERLLSDHYSPVPGVWDEEPLDAAIDEIASGSFKHRNPPEIRGAGYVVQSLEAALWAFHRSDGFREGCLMAVNLGDDADTTSAIYGQLAGAVYGESGIPASWRSRVAWRGRIVHIAEQLFAVSRRTE